MKHRFAISFLVLAVVISFSSCQQQIPPRTEFVLGTICTVNLYAKGTDSVYSQIFARLRALDATLSANRDDSNLAQINASSGIAPTSATPETLYVLREALLFSAKTEGAFDPSIGPLVKAWNIGTDYAAVPDFQTRKKALSLVDYHKVHIDTVAHTVFLEQKGMKLDLGAIAKGYAADECVRIARNHKINRGMIDLGGNIYALGEKAPGTPWTIGIRNPEKTHGEPILSLPITNQTVVTSGIFERYFEENGIHYHHILDTATGFPKDNELLSVTIISSVSMVADALSTSTFLLGTKKGLALVNQFGNIDAIFINKNHTITITPGLHGKIKILDPVYTLCN